MSKVDNYAFFSFCAPTTEECTGSISVGSGDGSGDCDFCLCGYDGDLADDAADSALDSSCGSQSGNNTSDCTTWLTNLVSSNPFENAFSW